MLYVYKSMVNNYRNDLLFVLAGIMIISLFFSRALLSVSVIAFVTLSFLHSGIGKQLRSFLDTPLLWGMTILFFVPFVSGLWSEDKQQWMDIVKLKLPLLFLPVAFASPIGWKENQWKILSLLFIVLVFGGTVFSIYQYLVDFSAVNETYLKAKTMTTPLENDHVRFSLLVSIGVWLSFYLFTKEKNNAFKWVYGIMIAWLVIFLHVLAARTGLLCIYLLAFSYLVSKLVTGNRVFTALIILLLMAMIPFLSYRFIPSFQNRVKFFLYEKGFFEKTNYLQGGTDAVRIISLKAGWNLMNAYPFTGTGFGDLKKETDLWYGSNYDTMKQEDKILPSSEWLVYGTGCGWPGFIIFSLAMIVPFFSAIKDRFWWWSLCLIMAFSLVFDIGLEVQFGIFIYAFIILTSWKWFAGQNP